MIPIIIMFSILGLLIIASITVTLKERKREKEKGLTFVLNNSLFFVKDDHSIVKINQQDGWRLVKIDGVNYVSNELFIFKLRYCEEYRLLKS